MMSRWVMVFLAAAALAAAGGCDRTQTVDASTGAPRIVEPRTELVGQANPPVPDLPVPTGFSLSEKDSRNFAVAGMRSVEHIYEGSADKFAVKRFYQRQMPVSRWILMSDFVSEGVVTLEFEKEGHGERCLVTITSKDFLLFHTTRIAVRLWTSGPVGGSGAGSR